MNEYATTEHALKYLARADKIPHRVEGETVLLEFVPHNIRRILDLGSGDGRLIALLRIDLPLQTQLGWLREIGFQDVDCHWNGSNSPSSEA